MGAGCGRHEVGTLYPGWFDDPHHDDDDDDVEEATDGHHGESHVAKLPERIFIISASGTGSLLRDVLGKDFEPEDLAGFVLEEVGGEAGEGTSLERPNIVGITEEGGEEAEDEDEGGGGGGVDDVEPVESFERSGSGDGVDRGRDEGGEGGERGAVVGELEHQQSHKEVGDEEEEKDDAAAPERQVGEDGGEGEAAVGSVDSEE